MFTPVEASMDADQERSATGNASGSMARAHARRAGGGYRGRSMGRERRHRGWCGLTAGLALVAALGLLAGGCASPPPAPSTPEVGLVYSGPALSLDSTGRLHIVRAEAPSPGWSMNVDYVVDSPGGFDAFISLRSPNPAFVYPQVMVTQHLSTGVESDKRIRLFARVVPFDTALNDWSEPHRWLK